MTLSGFGLLGRRSFRRGQRRPQKNSARPVADRRRWAPEGVAAADRSCASSAANLARHRRLFAGGAFCRVRALSLRSFQRAASLAARCEYPDFLDYAQSHSMRTKPGGSISRRRQRAQDPPSIHAQRASSRRRFAAHCQALGISTTFQLERGNHFNDAAGRTARGIRWLLEA